MSTHDTSSSLRPIDFSTFVLSLASSAQVHLGTVPNPLSKKVERDIQLARQTIDVLGILQDKTKGNLDVMEQQLLESVLADLRLLFVQAQQTKE